jgi:UDP-N-acetylmuramoyl-tripeptide--D-alanyl-D-alanine ligase
LGGIKDLGLEGTEIIWGGEAIRFGLPGKFNALNALAAVALAQELNISDDSIRRGLASVKPLFGRGEGLRGKTLLFRDCYNSNPESMMDALDFCDSLSAGRKVYVIGSMLELGAASFSAHDALGARLVSSRADKVFLFGEEIAPAAALLEGKINYFYTCDKDELSRALKKYIKNEDMVLLKGSRGCELETLSDIILGGSDVS